MQKHAFLLCGYSYTRETYKKFISAAPENWTIHTLDFRLYTKTKIADMHKVIDAYLLTHNINKIILIGHSLGGLYALNFAVQYPEKVKRMFLLDSVGMSKHRSIIRYMLTIIWTKTVNILGHFIEDLKGLIRMVTHPLTLGYVFYKIINLNLHHLAQKVNSETCLIWGEKDYLFPLEDAQRFHEAIKGSKLTILPGMDHDWPLHSPRLFWDNLASK